MSRFGSHSAIVLLIFTLGLHAATPSYTAQSIGYLSGASSAALIQVNNNGQVCGYSPTTGSPQPFLWAGGVMTGLGFTGKAVGCNDAGQVTGTNSSGIFVWSAGVTTISGASTVAGINNSGQVGGAASSQPYLWSVSTGLVTLGLPSGATSAGVVALNDSGQMVGSAYFNTKPYVQTYLYTPGSGMAIIPVTTVTGMNNRGQVVGHTGYDAQLWSAGAGLSTLGYMGTGNWAYAVAINDSGVIVGEAGSTPSDLMGHAFVYMNGVMTDLNNVTTGIPNGVTLYEGMRINNAGQIIVWISTGGYYLLTPVAQTVPALSPTACIALGMGLLLAGLILQSGRLRRRNRGAC